MAWLGWTSTPIRPGAAGAVTGPAAADRLTRPPRCRSSASLPGLLHCQVSSRARSRCPAVDRLGRAGGRPEGFGQPAVVDRLPFAVAAHLGQPGVDEADEVDVLGRDAEAVRLGGVRPWLPPHRPRGPGGP